MGLHGFIIVEKLPPCRDSLEVWMVHSDRVDLGDYEDVRDWPGGC